MTLISIDGLKNGHRLFNVIDGDRNVQFSASRSQLEAMRNVIELMIRDMDVIK